MIISDYNPVFFTATILDWQNLLKDDCCKDIICNSLEWLVINQKANIHGFVIMPNHMHLIWHILKNQNPEKIQHSLLSFTAQKLKQHLQANDPKFLERFKVDKCDREYQFWKRRPLSIDIYSQQVFWQKLNYIHNNPLQEKWKLCEKPEDYKYSSANFYINNVNDWRFLTPYY